MHAPACRCTRACDQDRGPREHMALLPSFAGPRTCCCRHALKLKPTGATRCVVRTDAQAAARSSDRGGRGHRSAIAISGRRIFRPIGRAALAGQPGHKRPRRLRDEGTAHRTPRPRHAAPPAAPSSASARRRRAQRTTNPVASTRLTLRRRMQEELGLGRPGPGGSMWLQRGGAVKKKARKCCVWQGCMQAAKDWLPLSETLRALFPSLRVVHLVPCVCQSVRTHRTGVGARSPARDRRFVSFGFGSAQF